jgi:hypothetical protein
MKEASEADLARIAAGLGNDLVTDGDEQAPADPAPPSFAGR